MPDTLDRTAVQAWIDDVVRYAPGLHQRLWGVVQDLLPPDHRAQRIHLPWFDPLPLQVARDPAMQFETIIESTITVPEPFTTYGPVNLDEAAAAMGRLLDQELLAQVCDVFRVPVDQLVGDQSSGFNLQQVTTLDWRSPTPLMALTVDDLRRARRLLEQDWQPPYGDLEDPPTERHQELAALIEADMAREHEPRKTRRQIEQFNHRRDLEANHAVLVQDGGVSDSEPVQRKRYNPWRQAFRR